MRDFPERDECSLSAGTSRERVSGSGTKLTQGRSGAVPDGSALLALSITAVTIILIVAILMLAPERPTCRREAGVPYRHAVCVAGEEMEK